MMRFSSDDIEVLQAFLEEAPDYLEGLEEKILKLESELSDENIDDLFRAFHSLKGMAGFANLVSVVNVCHELEDILKSLKNKQISFDVEAVDLLLDGSDLINLVVKRIAESLENHTEGDIDIEIEDLGEQEILDKVTEFKKAHERSNSNVKTFSQITSQNNVQDKTNEPKITDTTSNKKKTEVQPDFLKDFIEELKDKLEEIEENLLEFEKNQTESVSNNLMRLFHSIKGDSRLILSMTPGEIFQKTLVAIENISHGIEDFFQKVMNNKLQISPDFVDVIFNGMDLMKILLDSLIESKEPPETAEYIRNLRNMVISDENANKDSISTEPVSENIEEVSTFRAFENIALQWLDFLRIFLKSPSNDALEQLKRMSENVKTGLAHLKEDDEISMLEELLEMIENGKYDKIQEFVDDFEKWLKDKSEEFENKKSKSKDTLGKNSSKTNTPSIKKIASKTIRIDREKLDKLINLVGELVTLKNSFTSATRNSQSLGDLKDSIGKMERLANEFQSTVMSMRMVPISELFNRYKRTIRDLSRNLEKSVELHIEGDEIELDRTVIEELVDPLTHIIRNAVDHGIEEPEKRLKLGKSQTGNIYLRAYYKGSYAFIEVEDDGSGIDPNAVRSKAVERGLITAERAIEIPDDEIISFIFEPGFSTKKRVSNISGRGVGMDVVKTNIEKIGGKVFVESKLNIGTKITMRIPLSLSIILGLMFEVGRRKYIFPIEYIRETLKVRKEEIHDYSGLLLVDVRGEMIPLLPIEEVLHQNSTNPIEKEYDFDLIPLIIVEEGNDTVAFAVDRFLGESEFLIKSVPEYLRGEGIVLGATILGNGEVVLIIDPSRLVSR